MLAETRSPGPALPRRRAWPVALLLAALLPASGRADDGVEFFEKKVRPVLAGHCYSCHSAAAKKTKGGLRLDTPAGLRAGGDSGPVVKANDEDSLLLKAVAHTPDAPAMPPKGKLPDAAVADLRRWVKMGAPLPAASAAQQSGARPAREFWAFRPVAEHPVPAVSDPKWPVRKADYFILKKLDERKFTLAPPADRRTLARRAYFDLTGLPPTFVQVEAFAADRRPDAYEQLIDDLLASPRFGEKWARHWLDVARYAEDNPTSEATCKPPRFPYRYRDWVIGAFNADVPFDRFVRLQLAADLLPETPPGDFAALGFLGLSPVYHKEPKLSRDVIAGFVADEWDERVDVITRGFLGLTVACARCHDHKFDPISTADYYALAGVMANTQLVERPLAPTTGADPYALTATRLALLDTTLRTGYAKEMRGTAVKAKKPTTPFDRQVKQFEAREKELRAREKELDTGPLANVVRDAGTWVNGDDPAWTVIDYQPGRYRDLPIFARGDPARPGRVVPRRFLGALSAGEPRPFRDGSGRKELADAIVTDAAGLTARVFVNRVWGWVFGRPLVTTPSNFGALGDRPTHPELLDDLAARFVAHGWSVKWLVRELVTSAAYRQSTQVRNAELSRMRSAERGMRNVNPGPLAAVAGFSAFIPQSEFRTPRLEAFRNPHLEDPDDRWLWRAPRKRLTLEEWRDAALQVSGRLDLAGGGPSDDLDRPRSVRRTIYGRVSRQRPADLHRLFDLPDPKAHGEKRDVTTTPLQQLYFLNSPFARQTAEALAREATAGRRGEDGVRALFRRVLLRDPTPDELATTWQLVRPAREGDPPAWDLLAQVLLASNEFLFLN